MSKTYLIIGATSAMAEHTARHLAADNCRLHLAARDPNRIETLADDLRIRGAEEVRVLPCFDAVKPNTLEDLIKAVDEFKEPIDGVLIAHGNLPVQEDCERQTDAALCALACNFTSVIHLCTPLANRLAEQGHGTLAVISSVAGLRGRQSNYIYGAAKGGLNRYLEGLRNRLHPKGVRVLTILPGFVDTPMTSDIEKGPLFVSAQSAGHLIYKALTRSKADVVYVPFFWRLILWMIRAIPEPIFKRLKL